MVISKMISNEDIDKQHPACWIPIYGQNGNRMLSQDCFTSKMYQKNRTDSIITNVEAADHE